VLLLGEFVDGDAVDDEADQAHEENAQAFQIEFQTQIGQQGSLRGGEREVE